MKMTLSMLLISIRNRISNSIDDDDQETLSEIKTTLTILRESSYDSKDDSFINLIVRLEDVARDGGMGMALKQELPSEKDIKKGCD